MLGVLDVEERKECFGGRKEHRKSTSEENQKGEGVFSRVEQRKNMVAQTGRERLNQED